MTLFDINKAEAASKAVELYRDQRPTRNNPKLTLRQCADKFNAHYSLVRKYNVRYQKGERIPGYHKPGRQPALNDAEEELLARFVGLVHRGLFPLTSASLISYGDFLRALRVTPPASMPLTYRWAIKWKRDNPQIARAPGARDVSTGEEQEGEEDAERRATPTTGGTDLEGVEEWFKGYSGVLQNFQIRAEDLWNFDESPFFVGVVEGEMKVLVARNKKKRPRVLFAPGDREGLKVVDCVSAAGAMIPSYLILLSDILREEQTAVDVNTQNAADDVVVKTTSTRYYNAENALDWIRHFNAHSFAQSPSFSGTIEDWFGYPATIDPAHGDPRNNPNTKPRSSPRIHRVLLMDGFNAHEKPAILLYCEYFDIIAVSLPAHTTTPFQPFDIGLYRHLKAAQRGSLHKAMQATSTPSFSRTEILNEWTPLHDDIFTPPQILDAFSASGLWPIDPTRVTSQIKDQIRLRQEREIPAFKAVEGSYYLTHAGRADTLVTDPVLEGRLALVWRWRCCRSDAERWEAVASSAMETMMEIPEVAEWIRRQPGEGRPDGEGYVG